MQSLTDIEPMSTDHCTCNLESNPGTCDCIGYKQRAVKNSSDTSDTFKVSKMPAKAKRTKPKPGRPALPWKVEHQVAYYGLTPWAIWVLRTEFEYTVHDIGELRKKLPDPFVPWGDPNQRPNQMILKMPKTPKPKPPSPTRKSRRHAGQTPEVEMQDNPDKPVTPKKKPHRYRPGAVAFREIRRLQRSTKPLIPYLPFKRTVKEYSRNVNDKIQWSKVAVKTLQEAAEQHTIRLLDDAYWCTRHRNRATLMIKDMNLVQRIQGWQY